MTQKECATRCGLTKDCCTNHQGEQPIIVKPLKVEMVTGFSSSGTRSELQYQNRSEVGRNKHMKKASLGWIVSLPKISSSGECWMFHLRRLTWLGKLCVFMELPTLMHGRMSGKTRKWQHGVQIALKLILELHLHGLG